MFILGTYFHHTFFFWFFIYKHNVINEIFIIFLFKKFFPTGNAHLLFGKEVYKIIKNDIDYWRQKSIHDQSFFF